MIQDTMHSLQFPTDAHRNAAAACALFFSNIKDIQAVLLTCSCARGKATKDSCVDIAVLQYPDTPTLIKQEILTLWNNEYITNDVYSPLKSTGKYSMIDLVVFDGNFREDLHEWTSGPDPFELEIGNFIAYSKPLFTRSIYYNELRLRWLPYYNDEMRRRRLSMIKVFCINNLHHIPLYVERKLYFQSFSRLYHAMGEFLQALFITNRVYPISYDKWIYEQLNDFLHFPELYTELVKMMEYRNFESDEHVKKAEKLEQLLLTYCDE
jgi:predicted nucleotidyltransferase